MPLWTKAIPGFIFGFVLLALSGYMKPGLSWHSSFQFWGWLTFLCCGAVLGFKLLSVWWDFHHNYRTQKKKRQEADLAFEADKPAINKFKRPVYFVVALLAIYVGLRITGDPYSFPFDSNTIDAIDPVFRGFGLKLPEIIFFGGTLLFLGGVITVLYLIVVSIIDMVKKYRSAPVMTQPVQPDWQPPPPQSISQNKPQSDPFRDIRGYDD